MSFSCSDFMANIMATCDSLGIVRDEDISDDPEVADDVEHCAYLVIAAIRKLHAEAGAAPELLRSLILLQNRLHESRFKLDVRKDWSLMVADAQASRAIHEAGAK